MSTLTKEEIAAIEQRVNRATKGPWLKDRPAGETFGFANGVIIAAVARGQYIYADPPGGSFPESDRDFIAHAREDIPRLLAHIAAHSTSGVKDALGNDIPQAHGKYDPINGG